MAGDSSGTSEYSQGAARRLALVLVFVWVGAYTYSEDVIDIVKDVTASMGTPRFPHWVWVWAPLAVDIVLIAASWPLKRRFAASDGDGGRLWGWWTSGALLTVAVHLMMDLTEPHQLNAATVWLNILASLLFVIAMGMLLTSALNADPMTLFSWPLREARPRDWIRTHSVLPLIVGTFFGYLATPLWYPVITMHTSPVGSSAGSTCAPSIDPAYFAQMSSVIPLLLITLGMEFNYIRRTEDDTVQEPIQRAAPILTVILLCLAEVLSFSALVGNNGCGLGAVWHEYFALIITAQASAIGLATIVWLLLSSPAKH